MTHTPPTIGPLPQAPPPDPTGQPSQPRHHNPWDDGIVPARPPDSPTPGQALILVDLSAWPQIQAKLPVAVPITLLIQALELTLGQLRELYIQSEVRRMRI